ncbi:hypothetical protein SDRG_06040 [Saprolegnia diclina VS20]|uniref:Uncharacterized protein n=1 Tax=Saprolegnia diclina (strain VS20) TaxID=1156394 RepID=T0QPC9_SAPDV|nr:hypothetical protein SDRG_06040 [Saprolegnia diclina VS20]EQC36596.1 hypothetical protein SDRG_06040 [Saprolegnia diclina VS20]|eukprot:XP_008610017.1 hypothetical protein SDRG_06040 [Saprolegnia diclina VS20]
MGQTQSAFEAELAQAATDGDLAQVQALLAQGVSPNATKWGYSALYNATWSRREDVLDCLLAAGANVNYGGSNVPSPLAVAVEREAPEAIFRRLLAAGATVDTILCEVPLLGLAVVSKHTWLLPLLLDANPNVNLETKTKGGALFQAAHKGDLDAVNLLLAKGALVNGRDSTLTTPLWTAACHGHADVVDRLLLANVNVHRCNDRGETPLFAAAAGGHTRVVTSLLAAGANVHQGDNQGITPLVEAAAAGHADVVAILLAANATIECTARGPMVHAATRSHTDVVLLLCRAIVDRADKQALGRDASSDNVPDVK